MKTGIVSKIIQNFKDFKRFKSISIRYYRISNLVILFILDINGDRTPNQVSSPVLLGTKWPHSVCRDINK